MLTCICICLCTLQGGETQTLWEKQIALLHEASVHAAARARREAAHHQGNAVTAQAGPHLTRGLPPPAASERLRG